MDGALTVTVTGPIAKRCPFRSEFDIGMFQLTYRPAPAHFIELHELADTVSSYRNREISHEAVTQELADLYGAEVTTVWTTAGLRVECTAGDLPDNAERSAGT